MTVVNPFSRIQMSNTLGGADGTFGQWGPTVNISNALPNSIGKPLDWWARGDTSGTIANAVRKGNSPNLFSVTILNATDGQPADPGYVIAFGDGTISWTDGPVGNVVASTTNAHAIEGPLGQGAGFRIQVPNCSQWPDWWLLKVWAFDYPTRRMRYKASLDNPLASYEELWLDPYVPGPTAAGGADDYTDWTSHRLITHEIKFAADAPGQTMTFDMTRTYQYWPTIYAAALYKAKIIAQPARGAIRAQTAIQRGRPAGG